MAFNKQLVVTWYDTSGDVNNNLAFVRGAFAGAIFAPPFAPPFTSIFPVAKQAGYVPWSYNKAYYQDYQTIGVEYTTNTFLAAWGGDARYNSYSGVFAARLQ